MTKPCYQLADLRHHLHTRVLPNGQTYLNVFHANETCWMDKLSRLIADIRCVQDSLILEAAHRKRSK